MMNIRIVFTWIFFVCFIIKVTSECNNGTELLTAEQFPNILSYPGDGLSNYNISLDHCWNILSTNKEILISWTSNVGAGDHITLYDGSSTGAKLIFDKTDKQDNTHKILTTSSAAFLRFTSDGTLDPSKDKGFILRYVTGSPTTVSACNTTVTGGESVKYLSSPNFPNKYDKSSTCKWFITSSCKQIQLYLKFMDVERATNCKYDAIQVIDPISPDNTKYCGEEWTPDRNFISNGSSIEIVLISDDMSNKNGFVFSYEGINCSRIVHEKDSSASCGKGCIAAAVICPIVAITTASFVIYRILLRKTVIDTLESSSSEKSPEHHTEDGEKHNVKEEKENSDMQQIPTLGDV